MKEVFLLLAIIATLSITSCSKKFTCNWTDGTPYNIVFTEEIKASSLDDAEVKCRLRGIECSIE